MAREWSVADTPLPHEVTTVESSPIPSDAKWSRSESRGSSRPSGPVSASQGALTAVDTRDTRSYERAHIPGAVSFPLEEVRNRLAELHMLPTPPIFYCRTGKESKELADELATQFENVGFLEGGLLAWEAEQLPIERPE